MSFVATLVVDYLGIVVFELGFVVSGGLVVAGEKQQVGEEKKVGEEQKVEDEQKVGILEGFG